MRDHALRDTAAALELFEKDLSAIELHAREHETADSARFAELQGPKGMAGIHATLAHLGNLLTVIQDAQIEGFRLLNERLGGIERRSRNGNQ